MRICFATNNLNKVNEINTLIPAQYQIVSLKDIECHEGLREDQKTIEGNSHQKADYVARKYNINCFADDSGLEVFALDGHPGVDSAHYAGEHRSDDDNINLLLENLTAHKDRRAQFKTVITLVLDGKVKQFEGIVKGRIIEEKRGTQGFGYDPVFVPNGDNRTFAEMPLEEKNRISHRAIAVRKLIEYLSNLKRN